MYIQFVEKSNPKIFKSPILYIHCDEKEFKKFLKKYLKELYNWQKITQFKGFPLGRLEATTVMCDFMHKLTLYYLDFTLDEVKKENRIISWMRLMDSSHLNRDKSELEIIKLQEPI